MRMKRCKRCHKDFLCYNKEVYCEPCRIKAKEEALERQKQKKRDIKNRSQERDKQVSVLAQIAKEQGLSYGQYKAKLYLEKEKA